MLEAAEVLLRLLGIFYLLASLAMMRAVVMDHLMDQMLAGISLKPIPRKEHIRRWLMGGTTVSVGMGGAALLVLSLWAVPLFVLGSLLQLGYLLWARTAFAPEDDLDRKGRRQTIQAALFFGGATALVLLGAWSGLLRPWLDPWALVIPVAGLVPLVSMGRHFLWKARPASTDRSDEPAPPRQVPPRPARIRLAPMKGFYPVRNSDNDDGVTYDDYVPEELGDRIYAWTGYFLSNMDYHDPEFWVQYETPEEEEAHRAEGLALIAELEAIFGVGNVEGPDYPADIRYGPVPPTDLEA